MEWTDELDDVMYKQAFVVMINNCFREAHKEITDSEDNAPVMDIQHGLIRLAAPAHQYYDAGNNTLSITVNESARKYLKGFPCVRIGAHATYKSKYYIDLRRGYVIDNNIVLMEDYRRRNEIPRASYNGTVPGRIAGIAFSGAAMNKDARIFEEENDTEDIPHDANDMRTNIRPNSRGGFRHGPRACDAYPHKTPYTCAYIPFNTYQRGRGYTGRGGNRRGAYRGGEESWHGY
jgi:hypothetical protein